MERHAFKMFLRKGNEDEYRRRHDAIWPELAALLRASGVSNYSIHLDPSTGTLFAYLERTSGHRMDSLAHEPTMRRWWAAMAPLMETDPDGRPRTEPLTEMFHLP